MEALEMRTSKLPAVEIVKTETALGRSTIESLQTGLYWGQIGQIKEIVHRLSSEIFTDEKPFVIGTGGMASLFNDQEIFDFEEPDLVLQGLNKALQINL